MYDGRSKMEDVGWMMEDVVWKMEDAGLKMVEQVWNFGENRVDRKWEKGEVGFGVRG